MRPKNFTRNSRAFVCLLSIAIVFDSQLGFAFSLYQWDDRQDQGESKHSLDQIQNRESQPAEKISKGRDNSANHFTPSYNTTALISEASKEFLSPNVTEGIKSGQERVTPNQLSDQQKSDNTSESKLSLNKWNNDGSRSGMWERPYSNLNSDTKKEVVQKLEVQSKSSDVRIAAPAQAALNAIKSGQEDKVMVGVSFKYDEQKSDGQKIEMTGVGKVAVADQKVNQATAPSGVDPKNESLKKLDMASGVKMGGTSEQGIKDTSNQNNAEAKLPASQDETQNAAKVESPNQTKEGNNQIGQLMSLGSELKQSITNTVTNLVASIFPGSKETQPAQESKSGIEPGNQNPGTGTPVNNASTENPTAPATDSTSKPTEKTDQNSNVALAGISIPGIGNIGSNSNVNNVPSLALSPTSGSGGPGQIPKSDEKSKPTDSGLNIGNNYSQSNTNNVVPPLMLPQKETSQSESGVEKPANQEFTFKDAITGAEMRVVKETDGNTTRTTISRQDGRNLIPVKQIEKVTDGNTTTMTTSVKDGENWTPVKQTVVTRENGKVKSVETMQANSDGTATRLVQQFDGNGHGVQVKATYFQNGQVNMEKTEAYGRNYGVRYTATGTFDAKTNTVTQTTAWEKDKSTDPIVLRYLFGGIRESNLGIVKEGSEWGIALLAGRWGGPKTFQTTLGALKLAGDSYLMRGGDPNVNAATLVTDAVIGGLPYAGKIPGVASTGPGRGLNELYNNSMSGYLQQMLPMAGSFAGLEFLGFSHLITGDFKGLIERWKSPETVAGETVSGFGNGLTLGGPASKTSVNIFGNAGKIVAERGITGAAIGAASGERITVGIPQLLGKGARAAFNSEKAQTLVQGGAKMVETAAGMNALQQGAQSGVQKGLEKMGAPEWVQQAVSAAAGAVGLWFWPGGNNKTHGNAPPLKVEGQLPGKSSSESALRSKSGQNENALANTEQPGQTSRSSGANGTANNSSAQILTSIHDRGVVPGNQAKGYGAIRGTDAGIGLGNAVDVTAAKVQTRTAFKKDPSNAGLSYESYVDKQTGILLNKNDLQRSPVGVVVERTSPDLGKEITKSGKNEVEARFNNCALVLGASEKSFGDLRSEIGFRGTGQHIQIKGLESKDIVAVFVPGEVFDKVINQVPKELQEKLVRVSDKADLSTALGNSYMSPSGISVPNWHQALKSFFMETGRSHPQTYILHGVRLPTPNVVNSGKQPVSSQDKAVPSRTQPSGGMNINMVARAVDFVKGFFGRDAKSEPTQNRSDNNRALAAKVPDLPSFSGTREQIIQQINNFHEGLNSISGVDNQLKAVTSKFGNNEWGYRVVQNGQTGQQRVVVDLLAPGSGVGGGPNGLGAYQGTPHSKSMMDQVMRSNETVVGEGHTHIGNTPLSHQDFDNSPMDRPTFVYIPGIPQAGIAPTHLEFTSRYAQPGSRQEMLSQGWNEYRNFYETGKDYYRPIANDGSRLKWDDLDAHHFTRPVGPPQHP